MCNVFIDIEVFIPTIYVVKVAASSLKFLVLCFNRADPVNEPLLFVHQNSHQKRIMRLYGNEISVIDSTYKTCRYDVALYTLCCPTGSGYQTIGEIVCSRDDSDSIALGLKVCKKKCTDNCISMCHYVATNLFHIFCVPLCFIMFVVKITSLAILFLFTCRHIIMNEVTRQYACDQSCKQKYSEKIGKCIS